MSAPLSNKVVGFRTEQFVNAVEIGGGEEEALLPFKFYEKEDLNQAKSLDDVDPLELLELSSQEVDPMMLVETCYSQSTDSGDNSQNFGGNGSNASSQDSVIFIESRPRDLNAACKPTSLPVNNVGSMCEPKSTVTNPKAS